MDLAGLRQCVIEALIMRVHIDGALSWLREISEGTA